MTRRPGAGTAEALGSLILPARFDGPQRNDTMQVFAISALSLSALAEKLSSDRMGNRTCDLERSASLTVS